MLKLTIFNCFTEQIDLLDHIWQVANHSNASATQEGHGFPVLHVGLYSTLSVPLRQVFGHRCLYTLTDSKPPKEMHF